jgi:hypothetical protein
MDVKKNSQFLIALGKWLSNFTAILKNLTTPKIMKNEQEIASATSLENYRRGVMTLMELKSGKLITNSEPSHAAILFEVFFNTANEQVRILCKNLSRNVFGNHLVYAAAQSAVKRGVKLAVLIQDEVPEKSDFSDWLQNSKDQKISFRRASGRIRNASVNYAVMDSTAFRFEEDRGKCSAVASMHKPELATFLAQKFDEYAVAAS